MKTTPYAQRLLREKQIPSMSNGFTIQTGYGDFEVSAEEAAPFVDAAIKLLEARKPGGAQPSPLPVVKHAAV